MSWWKEIIACYTDDRDALIKSLSDTIERQRDEITKNKQDLLEKRAQISVLEEQNKQLRSAIRSIIDLASQYVKKDNEHGTDSKED